MAKLAKKNKLPVGEIAGIAAAGAAVGGVLAMLFSKGSDLKTKSKLEKTATKAVKAVKRTALRVEKAAKKALKPK